MSRLAKKHHDGCSQCNAAADFDTRKCTWHQCHKLFCACCASHCTECGDVVCADHLKVVSGEAYCPTCGDQQYEHYQQFFELMEEAHRRSLPCPVCAGTVEDDSDPFGDPDVERRYCCYGCGSSATMKRTPNEALRTAQALRYTGAASLPEPDYIVTEGAQARRKPAGIAPAVDAQEVRA